MIRKIYAKMRIVSSILSSSTKKVIGIYESVDSDGERSLSFSAYNVEIEEISVMCDQIADMSEYIFSYNKGEELINSINRN